MYIPMLHTVQYCSYNYKTCMHASTIAKLRRVSISVTIMSFRISIDSGLVVIVILLNTVSLSHEVVLNLTIDPVTAAVDCIGGGIGLTNTSVVVEYRIVSTTSSPASVGEWRYLADLLPYNVSMSILTQLHDSAAADGFQLRLLQLEHGGGMCNCWKLTRISVDCGVGMTDTSAATCSHDQRGLLIEAFCNDYASMARGLITEVYCNNSEPCPGDSDTLLPSRGHLTVKHLISGCEFL